MRKMDIKTANEYIKNYDSTMKKLGVDSPEKGFTQSVTFNRKQLQEWLQNLGPDTTEIKIHFAVYPSANLKSEKSITGQNDSGRFTTLLWPCNAMGKPANDESGIPELPANYGELEP